MLRKLILPLLFLFIIQAANAQSKPDAEKESKRLLALSQKLEGTYQVQIINSREMGEIPLQYMDTIVARRSKTQTVYFTYPNKKNVRIMIPSQTEIDNPNFNKLRKIVHLSQ